MSTVTISSRVLSQPLVCGIGPDPPTVSDGYSRWETIDRPKRVQAIDWVGQNAMVMTVNLQLDGYREDRSIEAQCTQLERLARPANATRLLQPSSLSLAGPVPHTELNWVVTAIEWLDVIYSEQGFRLRQFFNLEVTEYIDLHEIINNDVRQNKTRFRTVTVKKGYDLRQIAALMMGDSSLWRRIETIKGKKFRDPFVKPGTRVKVPIV